MYGAAGYHVSEFYPHVPEAAERPLHACCFKERPWTVLSMKGCHTSKSTFFVPPVVRCGKCVFILPTQLAGEGCRAPTAVSCETGTTHRSAQGSNTLFREPEQSYLTVLRARFLELYMNLRDNDQLDYSASMTYAPEVMWCSRIFIVSSPWPPLRGCLTASHRPVLPARLSGLSNPCLTFDSPFSQPFDPIATSFPFPASW